jgi:membrane-associated protease RseP (regulator of RpoE activity)
VLSAGSATHFVLALLIFYLAAVTTGLPNAAAEEFDAFEAPPVIGEVSRCVIPDYTIVNKDGQERLRDCRAGDPPAPARVAGLRPGDRFTAIGSTSVTTYGDFVRAVREREPGPVQVTYVRGGQQETVTVDLVATQRPPIGAEDDSRLETVSAIGVAVAAPELINDYGLLSGVSGAVSYTGHMVARTFTAIGKFPSKVPKLIDAIRGDERDRETPISVVGASRIGGEAAELDLPIVFLAALGGLNVFIGVFNLFPLLPLDGGHIAIIWFERARSWLAARRGRPDPGRVDYNKLMPVTLVVIVLFGGLTVLTLAADIVNPISLRQ